MPSGCDGASIWRPSRSSLVIAQGTVQLLAAYGVGDVAVLVMYLHSIAKMVGEP